MTTEQKETRTTQVQVFTLREDVDGLTERLAALEELVRVLTERPRAAAPATGARPTPNGNRVPHWLDFVRFGNKPCAGGCGTIIPSGPGRAWYEPATATSKAAVFCEPCGLPRDPNGGRP